MHPTRYLHPLSISIIIRNLTSAYPKQFTRVQSSFLSTLPTKERSSDTENKVPLMVYYRRTVPSSMPVLVMLAVALFFLAISSLFSFSVSVAREEKTSLVPIFFISVVLLVILQWLSSATYNERYYVKYPCGMYPGPYGWKCVKCGCYH